jgi:hypothetical protein
MWKYVYREYWPFSLRICDYSPIMQSVSIQRFATVFGDTDGSNRWVVRVLSVVNHVGIGMENTKLLCWLLYTPTRPYFLHLRAQLLSSIIWSYRRSCINIPPVATNASCSTFYPRTVASTRMHLDIPTGKRSIKLVRLYILPDSSFCTYR